MNTALLANIANTLEKVDNYTFFVFKPENTSIGKYLECAIITNRDPSWDTIQNATLIDDYYRTVLVEDLVRNFNGKGYPFSNIINDPSMDRILGKNVFFYSSRDSSDLFISVSDNRAIIFRESSDWNELKRVTGMETLTVH